MLLNTLLFAGLVAAFPAQQGNGRNGNNGHNNEGNNGHKNGNNGHNGQNGSNNGHGGNNGHNGHKATSTSSSSTSSATPLPTASQTTCNAQTYTYNQLAGYGFIPGDARDKFGDTIGGIGSAIAVPKATWTKLRNGSYTGLLWASPDRGWNTQGTINYQHRIQQYQITLTPNNSATVADPSPNNIFFKYLNTILLTDPSGTPTTGLDADGSGSKNFTGFPPLPNAIYEGDGFGGAGPGGNRVTIDAEGIIVNNDGSFFISDEYGPYVYRFNQKGQMIQAIAPPAAFIPMRNGSDSFSSDAPPIYDSDESDDVTPAEVDSGRVNNHGFEGLTASPDGKNLYVLLQAATHQDGGESKSTERYTRMLHYTIAGRTTTLAGEYVVPLPTYPSGKKPNTAPTSEFHYVSPTQFLILSRDSNAGQGQDSTLSLYRHADVFDISTASNIVGPTYDCATCTVAPGGVLDPAIVPATYCSFLDYNDNTQLNKYGVHNGGAQDSTLLNEKWESFAIVPVNTGADGEYFLFSMSDNDFITQNGYYDFGKDQYSDASGFNLNNQMLAFQITLPAGATPV